jgi:hypothetical protein
MTNAFVWLKLQNARVSAQQPEEMLLSKLFITPKQYLVHSYWQEGRHGIQYQSSPLGLGKALAGLAHEWLGLLLLTVSMQIVVYSLYHSTQALIQRGCMLLERSELVKGLLHGRPDCFCTTGSLQVSRISQSLDVFLTKSQQKWRCCGHREWTCRVHMVWNPDLALYAVPTVFEQHLKYMHNTFQWGQLQLLEIAGCTSRWPSTSFSAAWVCSTAAGASRAAFWQSLQTSKQNYKSPIFWSLKVKKQKKQSIVDCSCTWLAEQQPGQLAAVWAPAARSFGLAASLAPGLAVAWLLLQLLAHAALARSAVQFWPTSMTG